MTGRGRPPVGERVDVRLPADLLDYIDTCAKTIGVSRAAMVRHLLQHGMDNVTYADLVGWFPEADEVGWFPEGRP